MQTLKRAVIILALLIPFSLISLPATFPPYLRGDEGGLLNQARLSLHLPLPSGESPILLSPLPLWERVGVRGITSLFSVQSAEAYTYQDVENAYNNAMAQYPNDYIWKEEFEQDGQKGYKVWRRKNASTIEYQRKYYAEGSVPLSSTGPGQSCRNTLRKSSLFTRSPSS